MTPSGFSMGMILKTKLSRRIWASSESPVRKSRQPFIIQLALVSPGWTRLLITMAFRDLSDSRSQSSVVTVRQSQLFPARVLQRVRRRKRFRLTGSSSRSRMYSCRSV